MNLALSLVETAARSPDRVAIRQDGVEVTYRQLDDGSASLAEALRRRGVRPGDRVGLMLPNVPGFASAYYGVLRAGAIVVPINVLLKERELGYHLADSGAALLLAWHELADVALAGAARADATCVLARPGQLEDGLDGAASCTEVMPRASDDTAVILYTSGTTGQPKGAELTHENLRRNVQAACHLFGLDEDAVVLGAPPLFHAFGQTCALNATIRAGASLTLLPRFDAGHTLEALERDRVTVFVGVPTMYSALLHHPAAASVDASSLRVCGSGGASLPVEVLHAFETRFATTILEGYGLSETSPIASFNHPERERKPGSIGQPIVGVEMKVVAEGSEVAVGEIGEIVIRGHNVMKAYWERPSETAEAVRDGWLHTGDLARVDEDGYFFIVDRKKDLIIRGGYNVYPREVEEVLYEHPAVREAAVVAVADPALGEEVGAAVTLKAGVDLAPDELSRFVAERLAVYKYPRHVWFVDMLPKGPTGKILKREIERPAP